MKKENILEESYYGNQRDVFEIEIDDETLHYKKFYETAPYKNKKLYKEYITYDAIIPIGSNVFNIKF